MIQAVRKGSYGFPLFGKSVLPATCLSRQASPLNHSPLRFHPQREMVLNGQQPGRLCRPALFFCLDGKMVESGPGDLKDR